MPPFAVIQEQVAEAWPALGEWFSQLIEFDKPTPGHLALLDAAGFSPAAGGTFLADPVDRDVLVVQMRHNGDLVVAVPGALVEAEAAFARVEVAPAADFGIWQDESGLWWPLPAPPADGVQVPVSGNLERLDDILLTLLFSPTVEPAAHVAREPGYGNICAYLTARPSELWRADRSELDWAVRS